MRWPTRSTVPAAVLERAGLGRRERVLAHARDADGHWLLGTREQLVVLGDDGVVRVPWPRVHGVHWDVEEDQLRLSELGEFGEQRRAWSFALADESGTLLQLVRERVQASILVQRFVPVEGRRGLTVSGRRTPEGSAWFVEYDEGVDPDDPDVTRLADLALARARDDVGE